MVTTHKVNIAHARLAMGNWTFQRRSAEGVFGRPTLCVPCFRWKWNEKVQIYSAHSRPGPARSSSQERASCNSSLPYDYRNTGELSMVTP